MNIYLPPRYTSFDAVGFDKDGGRFFSVFSPLTNGLTTK